MVPLDSGSGRQCCLLIGTRMDRVEPPSFLYEAGDNLQLAARTMMVRHVIHRHSYNGT